ncbi:DUF397 domain-containing protein [Streptomyces sp. HD]|uniref:DUF397 domain-containing protein n=1 Tax=Streptomyces sp. HD TaxID=3020892 RepID=UPI00232F33CC|nr:DUF397 domain-containing protein [Streptomyces sp. HD]MDC0765861.1 DUF397 domain-containing protein [Streptomyces sp. HD]
MWTEANFAGQRRRYDLLRAVALPGVTPVRDSKDPDGPTLQFPTDTWAVFIRSL